MGDTNLDIFGGNDDPFAHRNSLHLSSPFGGRGYSQQPQPQFPALPTDEAEPLKQSLLNRTVSGLHYVGSTLDKAFGARALRGLAAGKPHELLSAIPGSDTMGLTKPEDAVSMDDLLTKHHRVFNPNDPNKWEFRDFAIPALEIAADPGTWISPFGAATKAGKLASGLGRTEGWTRKALTEGFTHTEPALKALGHSPEMLADMANRGARIAPQSLLDAASAKGVQLGAGTPLRGALGLGLPFREASTAIGTGRASQALAGFQDAAGAAIAKAPVIRHLRPLFDADVMRAEHPTVQNAAKLSGVPAREAVQSSTRAGEYQLATEFDRLMANFQSHPGIENEAMRVIRGSAEGSPVFDDPARWHADLMRRHGTATNPGATLATGVTDPHAVSAHIASNWGQLRDMGQRIRAFGQEIHGHSQEIGVNSALVNDVMAHYAARRYIAAAPGFGGTEIGRQFPTMHGSNMHRKEALSNVPGASTQLDEWAIDPRLSGKARSFVPAQVEQHVLGDMLRTELHRTGAMPLPGDLMPLNTGKTITYADKAREVGKWLQSVPEIHAQKGIPYFNPDIIGDFAMRGQRHAQVAGSAAAAIRSATEMARPTADFVASGERHVPLGDFLNRHGRAGLDTFVREATFAPHEEAAILARGFPDMATARAAGLDSTHPLRGLVAGMDPNVARRLTSGAEWHGAAIKAYERMAQRGYGPVHEAISGVTHPIQTLNQHALSEADADSIARFMQGWNTPTEMKPILGFMGGANQLFKNLVYPLWPASHFRNATSAVYNNALHGTGLGDYFDAARIMRSGKVKDPLRYAETASMTQADAGHFLNKGAYADAKVYSGVNSFDDRVGGRGLQDERLTRGLQGQERLVPQAPGVQPSVKSVVAKNGWQNLNPMAQAGVFGQQEDKFLPLVLGRRAGTNIEDFVRLSNYLGNVRRGMSSAKAGQLTRDIHFDYSKLAPFERNVMKQLIPFYTFMRNNLPFQANMAMSRPGSVSPMLHAMQATNPNQPWVPDYLASGASIPLDQEQDGKQRYLGSFGLPMEEAFGRLKSKNYELPWGHKMNLPSPGAMMGAFLGEFNPYMKAPLEAITGQQLKSGRRLEDLKANRLVSLNGQIPDEYAQPLTQLVANSPLARVFSSLQTGVDGRKGWGTRAMNLLTGARFTDVDMGAARNATMRSEINALLKSDPRVNEFTNYNVKPELRGAVPADLESRMRLLKTLQHDAKAFHTQKGEREKLKAIYGGLIPSGF